MRRICESMAMLVSQAVVHFAFRSHFHTSDYEAIVKLCDGFNGADLRNVCTEAGAHTAALLLVGIELLFPGMFAIRAEREYILEEDFYKAARKLLEAKKLESKLDYGKV